MHNIISISNFTFNLLTFMLSLLKVICFDFFNYSSEFIILKFFLLLKIVYIIKIGIMISILKFLISFTYL